MRAGDMVRATQLAGEAAARGLEHPKLLTLAAYDQVSCGDDEKALAYASRARELAPRDIDALNVLGACLSRLNRHREALAAFDAALRQSPGATHIRFRKACAHEDLSELSRARTEFERVVSAEPNNAEALAQLANLAALRGDAKAARDFASRALKHDPRQQGAVLALAMADIEGRIFDDAFARVTPLAADANTSPVNRAIAQSVVGDALDGLGKSKDAFTAYTSSKALLRVFYSPVYEAPDAEQAHARVARLADYFSDADAASWQAHPEDRYASPVQTHVFLVGFPRSGTTLLEFVLDSHPGIQSMEERDCLAGAAGDFLASRESLDRLAALNGSALAPYREAYWKSAAEFGIVPASPMFVDKLPLNSILLPLVAKLFPRAKILFALRDPRDVVLSCFRRRFGMSAQMFEFTMLESTARYYDAVMALAALYREKLALQTHELRYEDLIANFDGTVGTVCEFLGVAPSAEMAKFAVRAASRNIDTPSSAQVARGLFTQGVGQWRRYAAELSPVLPQLAPWLRRFGYSKD